MKEGIGEPLLRLFLNSIWNHQLSPFTTTYYQTQKKSIQKKKISLKNMYCHVFSCRFLISFTPAFSIFHVIWQWSWVCTISWVAELSIYTFAYFPYIILPFFKIMILFYFMFLYYFSIIITLLKITYTFCCCSSTIFYRVQFFFLFQINTNGNV